MTYTKMSARIYNEWGINKNNPINFFCDPNILFDEVKITSIIDLVKEEINTQKTFGKFLDKINEKSFSEKYLFLLTFVLLISGNDEDESSYWKKFNDWFGFKPQNKNIDKILSIFYSFCKHHKIPFFDVYQNDKQTNFCGRIYSLLPFTKNEINALAYIYQLGEMDGEQNDYYRLSEIVLSGYQPLFNNATLNGFKNLHDTINVLNNVIDFLPEGLKNFGDFFGYFLLNHSGFVKSVPVNDEINQKYKNILEEKVESHITKNDFYYFFKFNEFKKLTQFYINPRKGSVKIINNNSSKIIKSKKPFFIIEFNETVKLLDMPYGKYLAVEDSFNNEWVEIKIDKNQKVYKDKIVGYVDINNNQSILLCNNTSSDKLNSIITFKSLKSEKDSVDFNNLLNEYQNIDDGTIIQFTGGLRGSNGSYFWFALPYIDVHNNSVTNISMMLGDIMIRTQGENLKAKFLQFIENRIKHDESPFLAQYADGILFTKLDFILNNTTIETLKIQLPPKEVLMESSHAIDINCKSPVDSSFQCSCDLFINDLTDKHEIEKDQNLLHWLSWYVDSGVTYEQIKNAIQLLYFKNYGENQINQEISELPKLVKRVIQQYIGLGYINTIIKNGQVRYITSKARFIITHDGFLLLIGARSWENTLRLLLHNKNLIFGQRKKINEFIVLPRIIKLDVKTLNNRLLIDKDAMLSNYAKIGYTPRVANCQLDKSYPLCNLNNYSYNIDEINSQNYYVIRDINKYKYFDLVLLKDIKISNIGSVKLFSILRPTHNTYADSLIVIGQEVQDNEDCIRAINVSKGKEDEIVYLSLFLQKNNCPENYIPANLGWVYKKSTSNLYVPVKANMPHQIRHALQCAVGSYTDTRFAVRDEKNAPFPLINNDEICWCEQQTRGSFELEIFNCIPYSFIPILQEKLLIEIKQI